MLDQDCGPARAKGSEKQGLGKGIAEYFKEIVSGKQVLKNMFLETRYTRLIIWALGLCVR